MGGIASTSPPHGVKRRADEDLRDDQRLAKRFDLLNLDHHGKLYVPIPGATNTSRQSVATNGGADDCMQLDDTKEKVYIHNLEEQIAEIENEENTVFLPDIERKLGKIPHYLLTGDIRPTADNQMVLYGVPASISVPEEQDNVRRAIIESRARAREKQLLDEHSARARTDPVRVGTGQVVENRVAQITQEKIVDDDQADNDAMDLG